MLKLDSRTLHIIRSISLQFAFNGLVMATCAFFVLVMAWAKSIWTWFSIGPLLFFCGWVVIDLSLAIGFYRRYRWAYHLVILYLKLESFFPTGQWFYGDLPSQLAFEEVRRAFGLD